MKTRAEDRGDHWLVNGQKLWTTNAHHANKIFLLVRTDTSVKPQKGISMLLADMDTPGIEVRPVITIDRRHEVNEVFLTDVVVPKENIVGEPGQGWDIAKFLLGNERVGIAEVGLQKLLLRRLKALVKSRPGGHRYSSEVRRLEADVLGVEVSGLRLLKTESVSASEPSLLKLKSSDIIQRCFELALEIAGVDALPYDEASQLHTEGCWLDASVGNLFSDYCESRAYTCHVARHRPLVSESSRFVPSAGSSLCVRPLALLTRACRSWQARTWFISACVGARGAIK